MSWAFFRMALLTDDIDRDYAALVGCRGDLLLTTSGVGDGSRSCLLICGRCSLRIPTALVWS